jgi:hypothetical protein
MSAIQQLLMAKKKAGPITLTNQVLALVGSSSNLQMGYALSYNGFVYNSPNTFTGTQQLEQWVTPMEQAGLYEAMAQLVSGGPVTGGALNTWTGALTGPAQPAQWIVQANTSINQSAAARILVSVRRVGQVTPEATAYIDLSVHR